MRPLLVAVAGALGALTRYGVGSAVGLRAFPWATLGINVTGSLVLGFVLAGPGVERWSTTVTTVVAVGFLGAFTTFSTFSVETSELLRNDRPVAAAAYVGASVVLGVGAAAVGYLAGRASA